MNPLFSVSRARLMTATLILTAYPLFSLLSSFWRASGTRDKQQLPDSASGLLLFGALQLAIFGVFWWAYWGLARPSRAALLWQWRGGIQPILWGIFYSLALRAGLAVLAVLVVSFAVFMGVAPEDIRNGAQNQGASEFLAGLTQNREPVYWTLMLTWIPFVVAGLREELWRIGVLAGLWALCPQNWTQTHKTTFSIGVSSLAFGLGHTYQGATGVVLTTLLGAGLGCLMLHHRSIWPAVWAHGFFNALTFGLAPFARELQKSAG